MGTKTYKVSPFEITFSYGIDSLDIKITKKIETIFDKKNMVYSVIILVLAIVVGFIFIMRLIIEYLEQAFNLSIPSTIQFIIAIFSLYYIFGKFYKNSVQIYGKNDLVYSNSISNKEIIQKEVKGFYDFIFEKEKYLKIMHDGSMNVKIQSSSNNSRLLKYDVMTHPVYRLPVMLHRNGDITSLFPTDFYDEIKELFSDDNEFRNLMPYLNEFFMLETEEKSNYNHYILDVEGILQFCNYWVEI